MNGLSFASSVITALLWPLVVAIAIIVFRRPLSELIGRIKSYEGLGQKFTFGDKLADAEKAVGKAVESAKEAGAVNSVKEASAGDAVESAKEAVKAEAVQKPPTEKRIEVQPNPLSQDAEANPSFVVLRSWDQLESALNDLNETVFPGSRRTTNVPSLINRLLGRELITREFAKATLELRDLRNRVAHGRHNPTPGEAVAYAESVQKLALIPLTLVRIIIDNPS